MYMKAKIIDIEGSEVTIKTETGKFVTVPRRKLKFDCEINQKVVIEKNGDKIYILPEVPSFWGDDEVENDAKIRKKDNKNGKSGIATKVLIVIVVLCLIAFVPVAISFNDDAKEKERKDNLNSCINASISSSLRDQYSKKIDCYEKYGDENSKDEITKNERLLERVEIDECFFAAEEDYKVTDKERKDAGSDLGANLILVKRVGNKLAAQKECYTKYGKIGDYSSEISKIEADIKENQSMIEYGEEAQKSQNNYSKNWINCTTNTVGSSSYTNCY